MRNMKLAAVIVVVGACQWARWTCHGQRRCRERAPRAPPHCVSTLRISAFSIEAPCKIGGWFPPGHCYPKYMLYSCKSGLHFFGRTKGPGRKSIRRKFKVRILAQLPEHCFNTSIVRFPLLLPWRFQGSVLTRRGMMRHENWRVFSSQGERCDERERYIAWTSIWWPWLCREAQQIFLCFTPMYLL